MEGVIVLNSYEYLTNTGLILGLVLLCGLFAAAVLSLLILCLTYKDFSWKEYAILIFFVIATIVCGCLIPEKKYETRYQVTVDDSVSMNEFQSKYEIIEVEGKIYTVRERVE